MCVYHLFICKSQFGISLEAYHLVIVNTHPHTTATFQGNQANNNKILELLICGSR
ncbi:hypothetical protein B6N60_01542 [Richelia sinica FACHB-800]|uniref:Uncharacterized protein n=1 Tax=Richelia sinica FACHB-800 TaxID=1357546 RepID=A0A975T7J7_9NOST|nr:hypothetical protein [Richelia sinica]MBD2663589.1 hypothetical protein [Richelia sinica FACHB-800]QXE22856.1 hypothetical protein B6N60_01542 [Richelia sinica FACHB-800]